MTEREKELYSIALWSIRRINDKGNKLFALNDLASQFNLGSKERNHVIECMQAVNKYGNF